MARSGREVQTRKGNPADEGAYVDARGAIEKALHDGAMSEDALVAKLATMRAKMTPEDLVEMLGSMSRQGTVVSTPRGNWRLVVDKTPARSAEEGFGHLSKSFIYCPEIIADCPEFPENTLLHYVGREFEGFCLRNYSDETRVEVRKVQGLVKTAKLEAVYTLVAFDFDEDENTTARTENGFWGDRIRAANIAHADLLAQGQAAAGKPNPAYLPEPVAQASPSA